MLNLLGFHGARVQNVVENGKLVPYIMIPMIQNEVKYTAPYRQGEAARATVRCDIYPYSDNYMQAALQNQQKRGDEPNGDNVATHEMTISHTTAFIKQIASTRRDFVEAAVQRDKGKTQGLAQQNPNDENSTLFHIIRRILNVRVAQCYIKKPKETAPAPETAPTMDPSAMQPFDESMYQQPTNIDDLPF
jgi:hypothetical protein